MLDALGVKFDWDEEYGGMSAVDKAGTPLPNATLDSIRHTRLALKGPLTTPVGGGYRSVNVALRQEFDLYANVRPTKTLVPGGRYEGIDLVIIRENTEGMYVGLDHTFRVGDDPRAVAQATSVMTREGCRRICRYAFEYAKTQGRKKVTIVHKANILKATSGLFLETGASGGQGIRGRDRLRGQDRGQYGDAAGDQPAAVRRDRDDQPVRRHPLGRGGGADRRAGAGARGEHRHQGGDLRGGARLGAGHRGAGASPIRRR